MATNGLKNGPGKPADRKPAAPAKAASPTPAAAKAEKPAPPVADAPVLEPATVVTPRAAETVTPVPVETAPAENVASQDKLDPTPTIAATTDAVAEIVAEEQRKVEIMTDTNTAQAQALLTDFNDRTKAAVAKSSKLFEDANEFAKGNVEAIVESGKIAAKGLEAIGQDAAEFHRKNFENATAALNTLAAIKSPAELFKLQGDYFRTAFDSYVAEASKNTEALIKLAGDSVQPLSSRFSVAVEKVKSAA